MRNSLLKVSLVLAFTMFMLVQLKAQDVASITGVVTDPTGAVVPGVSVTLQNALTSASYKAVTNSVGSYTISNVVPGPGYKITFSRDGFSPTAITGLYMNVNATRTQNAKLQVGTTTQTIEVSASAEAVTLNTTDATVGNNFQVDFLNELPVANRDSPAALFTQQPGVTLSGAVTGARTDQNNVTLDGLEMNDNATGQFGAIVGNAPVDSVQEFRGVTAGNLSSAGQGGGGQYELVTKSGTNQFHGSVVEYHRDTNTEANDWFSNNAGVPRSPLIRNQFGGNIGGPIKKEKAFFFFDWNSHRDIRSNLVEHTVPMAAMRAGTVSYLDNLTTPTARHSSTVSAAGLKALDPLGIGFDPALLTVITSRYPAPNDLSGAVGDLVNTAGFRFNAPFNLVENEYVGKVDFNLTDKQHLFGKVAFARINSTQQPIWFPGDPQTYPFLNKSYSWVAGHTWTIGNTMVNKASYGEVFEDYAFPNTYNPTGVNQFGFGGLPSGGNFMSAPYGSAINAQARTFPIPVIRDDFSWQKGKHDFTFGGTFKYENPAGVTYLNYNSPDVGLGANLSGLNAGQRPADIYGSSATRARWDSEFTFALGRYQSVGATYNYDAKGSVVPQGSGSHEHYRFYETELYFGDTWKLTPNFTVTYGVRWQNYSVPYEVNGIESVPNLGFDALFNARVAQSNSGAYGATTDCSSSKGTGVPCVNYVLGGKANNAPGYFSPQYTNFAPRLAFTFSPSYDRKSVFNAGVGIIYDHTVVNAVQYQASQYSYLFQSSANRPFGTPGNPVASLTSDPRFAGFTTGVPAPPASPAAIKPPYTPFVDSTGAPFGLANGQAFNEGVDKNLKTPYSIQFDFGFQHEFPAGFLLKTNYVGRLGRRLLGQADANQLIEFPDSIGKSGQNMSTAFANLSKQLRANPNMDPTLVTPQPWFENMLGGPSTASAFGVPTNTAIISYYLYTLAVRGDFADTMQALSGAGILPDNVGMGSQFSEFTYYTNKGFSAYNGLLATLHKNNTHGLQFDINYTWSHSIDNVSVVANAPAIGGYGFICDVLRPKLCRGNSDFDVTHYLTGNFIYTLPFGRGQAFGATVPLWANEIIGGWETSGLPIWHSGTAFFANSNAFVAGYANSAPAILTGPISDLKVQKNKGSDGTLWAFKDQDAAAFNDYVGPIGFQIGSRNNLRGPVYFNMDLGLGKTFPIYKERVNLKFRCDAFNALNHPNFNYPGYPNQPDITESSGPFGVISSAATSPSGNTARVLQGSLKLEF